MSSRRSYNTDQQQRPRRTGEDGSNCSQSMQSMQSIRTTRSIRSMRMERQLSLFELPYLDRVLGPEGGLRA